MLVQDSDESALTYIEKLFESQQNTTFPENKVDPQCIVKTIQMGWQNTTAFLIKNYFNKNNIDLYLQFQQARQNLKMQYHKIFDNLTYYLPETSKNYQKIEPCYQWAQNMTHILIKFKFTRKWDVPGLLELNRINITVTMPELYLTAYGFTGDQPLKFELKIKTYKFMNPQGSRWKLVEMGQIEMEILKSPAPYVWRNLHMDIDYNPPNQYTWWDMYYRYRQNMEDGFALLEDTERRREDKSQIKQNIEERIADDKRYIVQANKQIEQIFETQTIQQMYCYEFEDGKYSLENPFEWNQWLF